MYSNELNLIFSEANKAFKGGATVQSVRGIPSSIDTIPKDGNRWLKIENVLCVFVDMKNSTRLSATNQDRFTANIYEYFTDTAVRVLDHFGADYIDVRGDGAFGLFNKNHFYHGMTAAITYRTFANTDLRKHVIVDGKPITCHIGADMKTVLVKRLGLRNVEGQTTRQNEVWAGKPVNMASKLASRGDENDLLISERVYNRIKSDNCSSLLLSCGCKEGVPSDDGRTVAWHANTFEEKDAHAFDFKTYYKLLPSRWCIPHHGDATMADILTYDRE